MSISGSNIALITGLWSICDDLGTDDLEVRIHRHNLRWYASWDEVNSATLESPQEFYRLQRVARSERCGGLRQSVSGRCY